jgi:hypothetical protein
MALTLQRGRVLVDLAPISAAPKYHATDAIESLLYVARGEDRLNRYAVPVSK